MTELQMKLAIAEMEDWKEVTNHHSELRYKEYRVADGTIWTALGCQMPDWLNDRDHTITAVENHWASKLVNGEPTIDSEGLLVRFGDMCEALCHDRVVWTVTPAYRLVMMDARKIAEAFLKATGRWKDNE